MNYCPNCGSRLLTRKIDDEGNVPYCNICNELQFYKPRICVLIAVLNDRDEIALTKQSHIIKDAWILISGYVKEGEDIEAAAVREVEEELGLDVLDYKYVRSYIVENTDMLMFGFMVHVHSDSFRLSTEIDEAVWFSVEDARRNILKDSIAEKLLIDIHGD